MKKMVGSVLLSTVLLSSSVALAVTQETIDVEKVEEKQTEEQIAAVAKAKIEAAKIEAAKAKAKADIEAEAAKTEVRAKAAESKAAAKALQEKNETTTDVAEKVSVTAKASKEVSEDEEEEHDGHQNAALAAGGVVTSGSGLPVGMTISTGLSADVGIFLPGYKRQVGLSPWLNLSPNFTVPKLVDWQPNMILAASMSIYVTNMFKSYNSGTSPSQNSLNVTDFTVALVLPALFKESTFTGINVTPVFSMALPLSMMSRQQNRLANFGASVQASWNTAAKGLIPAEYGVFGLQYRARLGGPLYTENSSTYACAEEGDERTIFGLPVGQFDASDEIVGAARAEERLGNGRCRAAGRQNALSISNSITAFYNISDAFGGGHTFTISTGLMNAYSRPLKANSSISASPFAKQSGFLSASEMSSGSMSYVYSLPIDLGVQLIAGFSSQQPLYNSDGTGIRFPFFDFSLGNSFTTANFTAVVSF